ncbi:hypothetical protein [Paraburkholderia sp.]|jgi:hypothetical protein|nr:hypothetical protein [Paraburkholderia sp.]
MASMVRRERLAAQLQGGNNWTSYRRSSVRWDNGHDRDRHRDHDHDHD